MFKEKSKSKKFREGTKTNIMKITKTMKRTAEELIGEAKVSDLEMVSGTYAE